MKKKLKNTEIDKVTGGYARAIIISVNALVIGLGYLIIRVLQKTSKTRNEIVNSPPEPEIKESQATKQAWYTKIFSPGK